MERNGILSVLCSATLDGRRQIVFVDLGATTDEPTHLCVRINGSCFRVLSCRDWFGEERRDDLKTAHLMDFAEQLGAGSP